MTPHLQILVRSLLAEDDIELYKIHEQFGLSPFQIFDAMNDLGKLGIAEVHNGRIRRSIDFFRLVLVYRHKIFGRANAPRLPRRVASHDTVQLDDYVPDYRRVDKSILWKSRG